MAYSPIYFIAANFRDYKNHWLKFYEPGTTTPKVIALESDGGTQVAKVEVNQDGFFVSAGSAIITPYVDGSYDAFLFPTEAEADANDTSSAEQLADDIKGTQDMINESLDDSIKPMTLAEAVANTTAQEGQIVQITDRANTQFKYETGQTPDKYGIIACTGVPSLSLVIVPGDIVNVAAYGAGGDKTTQPDVDDETDFTGELQAAFADAAGKEIVFEKNKYYQCRETLNMLSSTDLNLSGAFLRFNINGKVRCLVTNDSCTVRNGFVQNVTKDVTVWGAEYQQPICIGFSNSLTDFVNNVHVHDVTLTTTSPEGNACFVFGACTNILVENVDIPDNSFFGEPIGGHWSVEPGGDETQGTGHPHNITFRNITIGSMGYSNAAGACFLSAVRSFTLENISVEDFQNGPIIQVFAGDHGFTYALDPIAQETGTRLHATNINGKGLSGIQANMRDTLDAQVVWPSQITLENWSVVSRSPTDTDSKGIRVGGVHGMSVKNCLFDSFYNSVFLESEVEDLKLDHVNLKDSFKSCFDADNSVDCSNIEIKNCTFDGSNASTTGTEYDIVLGSFMNDITIDNNVFNSEEVAFNVFCTSTSSPRNVKAINNHVEASGGTNFVFGSSSSFGICELFDGNTQAETVTNNIRGGQQYVPYSISGYTNSQLAIKYYTGAGTPAYGTYNRGDITFENEPSASGSIGSVCTESGTQGTYAEGLTATTDGTATITLSAESTVLRKGMYLTINATDIRVNSISGTTIISDVTIPAGSGLAITYTNATFNLWGSINP